MQSEERLNPGEMTKLFAEQCAVGKEFIVVEAQDSYTIVFLECKRSMQVSLSTIDLLHWAAGHHLEGMAQCAEQVRIAWKRIINGETIGIPSR